ncbi:MAG: preprotein translocase subunit SecA [bacterium]|nr:preprotein translocase subunit SecA [bacterium]
MQKLLQRIFPDPSLKELAQYTKDVEKINVLEPDIQKLTDEELKQKTVEFKKRIKDGETVDDLLFEAFAVAREAAKRTLGQRYYDVQLVGGMVLHYGNIAEMRTGEGKTLTATAPLYLNALAGKGTHLITVNDYLAKRDAVWMGQVFHFLGLTVGCIQARGGFLYDPAYMHPTKEEQELEDIKRDATGSFAVDADYLRPAEKKEAYEADVTYGTNNEFGFDYLRDNMAVNSDQVVQRPLHFCVIDEVDSVLIDEARTPLIISAPSDTPSSLYMTCARIAGSLIENTDYNLDEKLKAATLTEDGITKVEKMLGIENLYTTEGVEMVHHIEEALRAEVLYKPDRDYVIRDGEVVIVDEFTGRLMDGRRYSEGLHQAIEAKENVEIKRESQTLATVTFQNYFRLYKKLSGMTGTALTDAEEFQKTYGVSVMVVPTNKPIQRQDATDRVYKSELGKLQAVAKEVKILHEKGQPILIGTVSIDKNEVLSALLRREGVPHEMLNAKNHEAEAQIIAQAGRKGGVTVATNMAGRGVDIILGGNPSTSEEAAEVKALGGLHVIGTERHESRRIDNQLRGRAGRQGDAGSTQFYVSMEDDLMRIFGSDRIRGLMERMGIPDDMPIENKMVSKSIEKAQERVEGNHYDVRKHLLSYDDVLSKHREVIYENRRAVLDAFEDDEEKSLREIILNHYDEALEEIVMFHTGVEVDVPDKFKEGVPETGDKNTKEILETISAMFPVTDEQKKEIGVLLDEVSAEKSDVADTRTKIIEKLMEIVRVAYDKLEGHYTTRKELKEIERAVILRTIDRLWLDHLDVMTALRQSIGLRGYGQRDPLVEYRRESFGIFNRMLLSIAMDISANFFKLTHRVLEQKQVEELQKSVFDRKGVVMSGARKTSGGTITQRAAAAVIAGAGVQKEKVGRNEPCSCGSGKKFKKCHGM